MVAQPDQAPWYQGFAQDQRALRESGGGESGLQAICVTLERGRWRKAPVRPVDDQGGPACARRLTRGLGVPVLARHRDHGIAKLALQHNVQGIIASIIIAASTGRENDAWFLTLPAIVDAVGGRVPVLVDGSFRRGTDILKALAFGAQAVLVGRPVMWGLAAYGADGVQGVLEMLQTELARYMAMCGKSNLAALDRTLLRVHSETVARG